MISSKETGAWSDITMMLEAQSLISDSRYYLLENNQCG